MIKFTKMGWWIHEYLLYVYYTMLEIFIIKGSKIKEGPILFYQLIFQVKILLQPKQIISSAFQRQHTKYSKIFIFFTTTTKFHVFFFSRPNICLIVRPVSCQIFHILHHSSHFILDGNIPQNEEPRSQ